MPEQWMTTVGKVVAVGETAITIGMKLVRQMEVENQSPETKKEHIAEIKKLCADLSDKNSPMKKWQLLGSVDQGTKPEVVSCSLGEATKVMRSLNDNNITVRTFVKQCKRA